MTTQPGDLVANRFRIERSLGRGGYGEVWEATQLSVDRRVALKVLTPSAQQHDEARLRFEREARLAARVRHPNAVGIIDFGESDGHFFLVMNLVTGPSLKEKLKQIGKFSPIDAARIGGRIAAALGAAHRLGLVHRDLKPANIILTEIDGEEQPVVIDFGLAKLWDDDDDGTHITRSNVMVGTPAYMAPEVVKGDTIDQRTDLYALGVLVHEMIAGQVPLRGKTPVETATMQVTATPPSLASRPDLGVPPALSGLVSALLAKNPDDRPRDADAVQDVLFAVAGIARSGKMPAVVAPVAAVAQPPADASLSVVTATPSLLSIDADPPLDATVRVPPPLPPPAAPRAGVSVAAREEEPAPAALLAPPATTTPVVAAPPATRRGHGRTIAAIAVAAALLAASVVAMTARRDTNTPAEVAPRAAASAAPAVVSTPEAAERPATPDVSAIAAASSPGIADDGGGSSDDIGAGGDEVGSTVSASSASLGGAVDAGREALAALPAPEAPTHGWVTVTVEPYGSVSIDGTAVGDAPVRRERVSPGRHTIEARQGERTTSERVTVEAGEEERVRLRFE